MKKINKKLEKRFKKMVESFSLILFILEKEIR